MHGGRLARAKHVGVIKTKSGTSKAHVTRGAGREGQGGSVGKGEIKPRGQIGGKRGEGNGGRRTRKQDKLLLVHLSSSRKDSEERETRSRLGLGHGGHGQSFVSG